MIKYILALALCLAGLTGTASAQYGGIVINRFGQPVVINRGIGVFGTATVGTPFIGSGVNAVVVRRGLFGLRRTVFVNAGFGTPFIGPRFNTFGFGVGPVFANRFVPGVGFVRVRVR